MSRQLLFSLSCSHFLSALQPLSRSLYWASGFSHAIFIQSMHFTLTALRLSAERVGADAFRLCVIFSASLSHASCYFARLCSDSRNCVKPGIRRFFCRFWSGQRGIGSQTRAFFRPNDPRHFFWDFLTADFADLPYSCFEKAIWTAVWVLSAAFAPQQKNISASYNCTYAHKPTALRATCAMIVLHFDWYSHHQITVK